MEKKRTREFITRRIMRHIIFWFCIMILFKFRKLEVCLMELVSGNLHFLAKISPFKFSLLCWKTELLETSLIPKKFFPLKSNFSSLRLFWYLKTRFANRCTEQMETKYRCSQTQFRVLVASCWGADCGPQGKSWMPLSLFGVHAASRTASCKHKR